MPFPIREEFIHDCAFVGEGVRVSFCLLGFSLSAGGGLVVAGAECVGS